MGKVVAVVGATGAVGEEMLRVLESRQFPVSKILALASPRSAGRTVRFSGAEVPVLPLDEADFAGVDVALFSAGASISREHAPRAVEAGAVVVDNSSAFRYQDDVPLVVPEVNPDALNGHRGLIANPNCSTIQVVVAVNPIHRAFGLSRMICCTYQAASGAGARGMHELQAGMEAMAAGREVLHAVFPHPLAGNVIPRIDAFQPNAYTREEMKMAWESRKIMGIPALRVSATCVRVPVLRAHSVAVHLETERPCPLHGVRDVLRAAQGVVLVEEPANEPYPVPLRAAGTDPVYVGRLRKDEAFDNGLALWVVADQLRKGAALNAVQIAELSLLQDERG